jgi:ABC-type phosphate transport system permease subunit
MTDQPASPKTRRIMKFAMMALWGVFALSCFACIRIISVVQILKQDNDDGTFEKQIHNLSWITIVSIVVTVALGITAIWATKHYLVERRG